MNDSFYSTLSTAELIERIARQSDDRALNEFLSYRKVLWFGGLRCILPEYLMSLGSSKSIIDPADWNLKKKIVKEILEKI